MCLSPADSRSGSKECAAPTPSTSCSTPSSDVGAPVDLDQLSSILETCEERVGSARRLRCTYQDVFGSENVVTWTQMLKEQATTEMTTEMKMTQMARACNMQRCPWDHPDVATLPKSDLANRVFFNPVTMEELVLPSRPQSRKQGPPVKREEPQEDYSPIKAYMMGRGTFSFPGSSHIVEGENAQLLMSNFY